MNYMHAFEDCPGEVHWQPCPGKGRCHAILATDVPGRAGPLMSTCAQPADHARHAGVDASPKTARRIDAECVAELIFDEYERIISCEDYGCEHSGDGDQVCWRCRKAIFVRVAWPSILKARE